MWCPSSSHYYNIYILTERNFKNHLTSKTQIIPYTKNASFRGGEMGFDLPTIIQASLVAQLVKNPPTMQENWVLSLGWEHSLEKGKATHSSILAWRITWTV